MGFNFTGLAISKISKNDISEISTILNRKLTFTQEIPFQEAMSCRQNNGDIDVYFGETGVLLFASEPFSLGNLRKLSTNRMVTKFVSSETAMYFEVDAALNGERFRDFMALNNEVMDDEGHKFENEKETDDGLYIVMNAISHTLGESFWGIEPDAKTFRYNLAHLSV
jgi:hypothetical protein